MLEGSENISKSDTAPAAWAKATHSTTEQLQAYLDRNQIPWLPTSTDDFESYFAERRKALALRVRSTLASPTLAPVGEGAPSPESESPLRSSIDEALAATVLGD